MSSGDASCPCFWPHRGLLPQQDQKAKQYKFLAGVYMLLAAALVKRHVAFGIYRATSHLALICLVGPGRGMKAALPTAPP